MEAFHGKRDTYNCSIDAYIYSIMTELALGLFPIFESFHDQGAHFTRDISSDVPVNYDTRRYLNSLKGMI